MPALCGTIAEISAPHVSGVRRMEQQFAQYGKLVLASLPGLDTLPDLAALAVLLCLAGLPILAVAGQGLAGSRGRSAYDKCARQLAHLGSRIGLAAMMAGGVALGMQYERLLALDMKNLLIRENVHVLLTAGAWLCVALFALLNRLYLGLWRGGRTAPRLHQLAAFLAALAAGAAVYAALLHLHGLSAPSASAHFNVRGLLMPEAERFWIAVSYAPFAALALAGGYGALWLLLRRSADDYGRDHYNLLIPWCAGWACNAWLLLWLLAAARAGRRVLQLYEAAGGALDWLQFTPDAVGLLVLLPPGLWWLGIRRSAAPLRAKIATPLAPIWATGCLLLLDMGPR
jgi:hypothetical protein